MAAVQTVAELYEVSFDLGDTLAHTNVLRSEVVSSLGRGLLRIGYEELDQDRDWVAYHNKYNQDNHMNYVHSSFFRTGFEIAVFGVLAKAEAVDESDAYQVMVRQHVQSLNMLMSGASIHSAPERSMHNAARRVISQVIRRGVGNLDEDVIDSVNFLEDVLEGSGLRNINTGIDKVSRSHWSIRSFGRNVYQNIGFEPFKNSPKAG